MPSATELTPHRSYVARHWCGELPLGTAFWRNGLPLFLALPVITAGFNLLHRYLGRSPTAGYALLCAFIACGVLWFGARVWSNVGVWRASERHLARGGQRVWASTAKAVTGVLVALDVAALVLLVCLPALAVARIALGIEHRFEPSAIALGSDGTSARLSGDVAEGTARQLEQLLRRAPSLRRLQLRSAGGQVYEAIEVAKLIRAHALETRVDAYCYSACTVLFMAGHKRSLAPGAQLAFHRVSYGGMFDVGHSTADMLAALGTNGASAELLEHLRNLPKGAIWRPSYEELLRYRMITD